MDNIVIVSAIIEDRRIEKKNTHTDSVKCLDKLWLQDCITELANIAVKIVIVTIVIQIAIICSRETVFSSSDISVTTTETTLKT